MYYRQNDLNRFKIHLTGLCVCLATRQQETPLAKYSNAVVLITDICIVALFE
jgi:hypothetical protein